jgi:hypothetical protein
VNLDARGCLTKSKRTDALASSLADDGTRAQPPADRGGVYGSRGRRRGQRARGCAQDRHGFVRWGAETDFSGAWRAKFPRPNFN